MCLTGVFLSDVIFFSHLSFIRVIPRDFISFLIYSPYKGLYRVKKNYEK